MSTLPLISPAEALHAANRRGVLSMVGAMAAFTINDTIVKFVSQSLPSGQLIFVRGAMATLMVLLVAHALGATRRLGAIAQPWVAGRAAIDALGTMLYLLSLFQLPLGNAAAINLAAPLFMVVFAVWLLRERPGAARWLAVGLGFAGVLCVVQPRGGAFDGWALVCLAGAVLQALRELMTRRIPAEVPSIVITLASAIGITLLAGGMSLLQGWQALGLAQFWLLAVAAAFLAIAYYLVIQAMRVGEVSLIAPFRYASLLFAVLLGYLVFGDVPNAWAWTGIALLVGSGLYVLHDARSARRALRSQKR